MARRLFLLALALGVAYAMWTALRDLPAEIDALPELVPPTEGAAPPMRLDATPAREAETDRGDAARTENHHCHAPCGPVQSSASNPMSS